MIQVNTRGVDLFEFEDLRILNRIQHFVSGRNGGQSIGPYGSLNLGLKVNDEFDNVIKNRKKLADVLNINIENFVIPSQCHSNNVVLVNESLKGKGFFKKEDAIEDTDSLITNIPEICLVIFGADCVPVLFFDPVKGAIGAAHAGWKGTVNKIVNKTVEKMTAYFGSDPANIIAGIGPSIGPCCYNVGADVIKAAEDAGLYGAIKSDSFSETNFFDLWQANKLNLLHSGLQEQNIEIAGLCTFCNHSRFFSHRYDKGVTGRFASGIMLMK